MCVCLSKRDFLKHYAASARTVTEASHKTFNEFGLKLLDVQLIHFTCADPATQTLLDKDIMSVTQTKQTKNRAKKTNKAASLFLIFLRLPLCSFSSSFLLFSAPA